MEGKKESRKKVGHQRRGEQKEEKEKERKERSKRWLLKEGVSTPVSAEGFDNFQPGRGFGELLEFLD